MKKIVFLMALIAISNQSFALFTTQLPDKIVCDAQSYCAASDDKYKIPGWTLITESHDFLKPGTYYFMEAIVQGDPGDNFIKGVTFEYVMVNKDGYTYYADYVATNWLMPINKDKYSVHPDGGVCMSKDVSDCYVNIIAPQGK